MPWTHPGTVLRLILLLMSSEFVRTGLLVAYLPLVAPELGLRPAAVGLILGLHYLADALAKGPVGVLTERHGLGRVLLLSAVLGLATLLLLHQKPGALVLALVSVLWGLCYAALWPGVMAAAQHSARPGMTSRALAITSVSVAPAIALGLLGVGQLMQRQPTLAFPVLLGGVAYGAFIAGWNGLVGRTLPPEYRAAAWGTVMAVESLGYAIGPVLGGVMWATYGQSGVFWCGAAILLLVEGYYLWPGRAVMRRGRVAE